MRPRQLTESPPRFPVSKVGSGKHLLAAMQSGTLQGCCSEVWPDNVDISKRKFSWEFKTESKREQIRTFWDLMGKSHSQFLETHSFSFQSTHTRGWKKKNKQTKTTLWHFAKSWLQHPERTPPPYGAQHYAAPQHRPHAFTAVTAGCVRRPFSHQTFVSRQK